MLAENIQVTHTHSHHDWNANYVVNKIIPA